MAKKKKPKSLKLSKKKKSKKITGKNKKKGNAKKQISLSKKAIPKALNPEIVDEKKFVSPPTSTLSPDFSSGDDIVLPEINEIKEDLFFDDRTSLKDEYHLDLPELNKTSSSLVSTQSSPISMSDPVSRYMAEISRYPLLTREQEEEVAKRYYETKDPRLAEVLVTANLRFVVKVAAEYSKFGAKLIDLIQEGNVGLMHAVKEFNPYKGVKLITYAVWWIRGYIQEYLMRQYSMVRIGTTQNQRKLFYQLQKEKQELDRLGEEQGIRQLSGRLGIPEEEVAEMHKRLSGRDVSLNQPLGQSETTYLLDMQKGEEATQIDEAIELKQHLHLLNNALDQLRPLLNQKESAILDNRLLADTPMTLQEFGDQWGVTREAVRQMEARLLNKIKETLLNNNQTASNS